MKIHVRCANAASIWLTIPFCLFWLAERGAAQGSLTPPAGPLAPNMVTLQQIEPRTPISSAPYTITISGSYYLTGNLTVSSGDAIDIKASGVTLDLNGFTISSTETQPGGTGTGIGILGLAGNVQILHGNIAGSVSYSFGNFRGRGFLYAVLSEGAGGQNVRVNGLCVSGCMGDGIHLGSGNGSIVESCSVNMVGGGGIQADGVASSSAVNCGGNYGISAASVSGSIGQSIVLGVGIFGSTVENSYGISQSSIGINGFTVGNSYGTSQTGVGLSSAQSAQNCYGVSSSATSTAYGLQSFIAEDCVGSGQAGIGLHVFMAHNCFGSSQSNDGLWAIAATSCYGLSVSGIGLHVTDANTCYGSTSSSAITGVVATAAYFCSGDNGVTAADAKAAGSSVTATAQQYNQGY